MSTRADKKLRAILGGRLRRLREDRGPVRSGRSAAGAAQRQVHRRSSAGEKSITIDSLYLLSRALQTPLHVIVSLKASARLLAGPSARAEP